MLLKKVQIDMISVEQAATFPNINYVCTGYENFSGRKFKSIYIMPKDI